MHKILHILMILKAAALKQNINIKDKENNVLLFVCWTVINLHTTYNHSISGTKSQKRVSSSI